MEQNLGAPRNHRADYKPLESKDSLVLQDAGHSPTQSSPLAFRRQKHFWGIRCSQHGKLVLLPISQAFAHCCNTTIKPPSTWAAEGAQKTHRTGLFPCSNGSSLSPTAASPRMGTGSSHFLPASLPSPGQPGRAISLPTLNTIETKGIFPPFFLGALAKTLPEPLWKSSCISPLEPRGK